jgi:hypothetical protein
MLQTAMDPRDFVAQLRAAFPATPITADGAFARWGTTYPDAAVYRERIAGQTWEQLDRGYLLRNSDALGFLGTEALVAVLPVYLRSLVEEGVWSAAAGMLMLVLARPAPGSDSGLGHARFDELVDALAPAQRIAVATALDTLARADADGSLGRAAQAALDGFWNLFVKRD